MATDQATRLTPKEYLAFERQAQTKHEYVDGELRAMTRASRPHVLIAGNVHGLLWNAARSRRTKRTCESGFPTAPTTIRT